jgi:hypothetical protein
MSSNPTWKIRRPGCAAPHCHAVPAAKQSKRRATCREAGDDAEDFVRQPSSAGFDRVAFLSRIRHPEATSAFAAGCSCADVTAIAPPGRPLIPFGTPLGWGQPRYSDVSAAQPLHCLKRRKLIANSSIDPKRYDAGRLKPCDLPMAASPVPALCCVRQIP